MTGYSECKRMSGWKLIAHSLMMGLTALTLLLALAPAFAQSDDDEPDTQLIEMGETSINGDLKESNFFWRGEEGHPQFEPIHRLEKSFMGEIEESGQAKSLE